MKKKKLKLSEIVILVCLVVGGVGYSLYEFYIKEKAEALTTATNRINELEGLTQNQKALYKELDGMRVNSNTQTEKIGTYKNSNNSFVLNAQNLLAYVGPVAEANDVSITLFKEMTDDEQKKNKHFTNMPFHLVLQGDYTNLLKVMDSIDGLEYNYTVNEYSMKVIDVDPKTNKPMEQTSKTTEYKWTSGNNTYVTGEFPLFRVEKVEEQTETKTNGESETKTTDFIPVKKVQIEFKINFIMFEQQNDGEEDSVDTETGKDNPFESDVVDKQNDGKIVLNEDYTGDELTSLTEAKKAIFLADAKKLQAEIDKTLLAITNREQKKMNTEPQLAYLKELLAMQSETKESDDTSSTSSPVADKKSDKK